MGAANIPAANQLNADVAGVTSPSKDATRLSGVVPQEILHFSTEAGDLGQMLFGHTIDRIAHTGVQSPSGILSELGGMIPHSLANAFHAPASVEGGTDETPGSIPQTITFLDTAKGEWSKLRKSLGI